MRIPYPERISYTGATVFATALLAVQLLEHTQIYFAFCCFAYIFIATAAFNLAGGLYRPVGAYVFFNATLTLIVGLVIKVIVGEPADSNLLTPLRTIQVYLLGMVGILIAAYIENRFRRPRPVISTLFPMKDMRAAYIGSAIIGMVAKVVYLYVPTGGNGTFLTAFHNMDNFLPFALIIGVIYTIRASNGQRSLTPGLFLLFALAFMIGLFAFSKQALYTPPVCWVIAAGIARFKLKPVNVIFIILISVMLIRYGPAYAFSRENETGTYGGDAKLVWYSMTHLEQLRIDSTEGSQELIDTNYGLNYFNQPEGIFDRLEMISPDDALIYATDRDGFFGYEPVKEYFENLIPHFLWPDKPVPYFGNMYAHEIGVLSSEDTGTGVSFGISGDAYHEGNFFGVIVVEPFCLIAGFLVISWMLGSVYDHPAVIVSILMISHAAPEMAMGGPIFLIQISPVIVLLAFTCSYILPVFTSVFERKKPIASIVSPALAAG